jgi:spore coat polysaccharide biosynthesis predicted glycosyltransferase SpsG
MKILLQSDVDAEFMELEDTQVWDMYCQVDIIIEKLMSMEEIKSYYGMGCVLFGFEYLPIYDEFITSDTYKDGNNKELLEYIVYKSSDELPNVIT